MYLRSARGQMACVYPTHPSAGTSAGREIPARGRVAAHSLRLASSLRVPRRILPPRPVHLPQAKLS